MSSLCLTAGFKPGTLTPSRPVSVSGVSGDGRPGPLWARTVVSTQEAWRGKVAELFELGPLDNEEELVKTV